MSGTYKASALSLLLLASFQSSLVSTKTKDSQKRLELSFLNDRCLVLRKPDTHRLHRASSVPVSFSIGLNSFPPLNSSQNTP